MFNLKKSNTVKHRVEVSYPSDNGTGWSKGHFMVGFKMLSEDEADNLPDSSDATLLRAVVTDVWEVGDEDGNELPNDDSTKAMIINNTFSAAAMIREYVHIAKGKNLKRKNS